MTDGADLKVGSFYWVLPVFDVDFEPPGFEGRDLSDYRALVAHWHNQDQPARFDGRDEWGREKWIFLGEEPSGWPVRWIGDEIVRKAKADEV